MNEFLNMNIRIATTDDIDSINRIYNQAIEDTCTADTQAKTLMQTHDWLTTHEDANYPVWVCELDRVVMGWISFSAYRNGRPAVNKTVECSYYVGREYQGRGIGTAMMRFAIDKARAMGFRQALAIILERNTSSIAFIEKFGFTRWGFLPGVADFSGDICGHCYYGLAL